MGFQISIIVMFFLIFLTGCKKQNDVYHTDVLVVGGSTGGIAAGLQSARLGVSAIIVEETPWLGGMLTSQGVSATDGNHNLHSGIWNEFRNKLRSHYGGEAALATGWVSNTQFEPHVGDSIFKAMAAAEKTLKIIHGYFIREVLKKESKIVGAVFENDNHESITIHAKILVDATDLGDVLPLAGASYDLGMESRFDTGENIAPEKANNIVQDLTWVAILKDYGKGADKTVQKPVGYNPEMFRGSCAMTVDSILIDCDKMIGYARLPNDKYLINWPRHGNDIYLNVVEMNREERNNELLNAKEKTLEFVYYIQNELGYKNLGLADDEFPTSDLLAFAPYHREGRRVKGIERLTINHVQNRYNDKPLYRTGISVGDYPVDHHHACKSDAPEIIFPAVPSFNIPMGCLIPESTDGLVVADKAISVSNVINGSTRLQSCVLLTGQAAGVIAALSVLENTNPRNLNIRKVQQTLLDADAYLMPLFDVGPDHPFFEPIQRVCASGILEVTGEPFKWANRSWFFPDSTITITEFTRGLSAFTSKMTTVYDDSPVTIKIANELFSDIVGYNVENELKVLWQHHFNPQYNLNHVIVRKELAVIIDSVLKPFETKTIDFNGYYK